MKAEAQFAHITPESQSPADSARLSLQQDSSALLANRETLSVLKSLHQSGGTRAESINSPPYPELHKYLGGLQLSFTPSEPTESPARAAARTGDKAPAPRASGSASGEQTESTIINGIHYLLKTSADGKSSALTDPAGEWDSVDGGKTWVLKGSNHDVWRGSININKDGDYTSENSDYGLKACIQHDGNTRSELTTKAGAHYVVLTNASNINTYLKDGAGSEWTSTDGTSWTNKTSGAKWSGTIAVTASELLYKPTDGDAIHHFSAQRELIAEKEADLIRQYGIKIPESGAITHYDKGPDLHNGLPTADELDCLKDVMDKMKHENFKGMNVWFLRGNEPSTYWGFYSPTNKDMVLCPLARETSRGWSALEGTLLHELTHHEQHQRWGDFDFGNPGSGQDAKDLCTSLGWIYSATQSVSLLQDKAGGYWKTDWGKTGGYDWSAGTKPDGKTHLTAAEMRERALVRPSTNYFTRAAEEHAEATAMFRMDRQQLAKQSPELYKITRNYDQQAIDRGLGKDASGSSKFIRQIDGHVVDNTEAARKAIKNQELTWGIR